MARITSKPTLEEAVLGAILDQQEKLEPLFVGLCDPDVFLYSTSAGQKFIDDLNAFEKYEVGDAEQLKTIRNLAMRNIIEADWVIKNSSSNDPKYLLANNTSWAQEAFSINNTFADDDCDLSNQYYIKMGTNDAKAIYNNLKRYPAQLSIDFWPHLVVSCDGKQYFFSCPKEGGRPYKIIAYVLRPENRNRPIFKKELNEIEGVTIGEKEAIGSKVFEKNTTIRETLSPFIESVPDFICVHNPAELTSEQFGIIKKRCHHSRFI